MATAKICTRLSALLDKSVLWFPKSCRLHCTSFNHNFNLASRVHVSPSFSPAEVVRVTAQDIRLVKRSRACLIKETKTHNEESCEKLLISGQTCSGCWTRESRFGPSVVGLPLKAGLSHIDISSYSGNKIFRKQITQFCEIQNYRRFSASTGCLCGKKPQLGQNDKVPHTNHTWQQSSEQISNTSGQKEQEDEDESLPERAADLKTESNIWTVPNLLTTLRMVVSPVIGYQVLHEQFTWACSLFVLAGISDMLDGYIARRFPNQTSALGSFIDPLADKLLISILFVTLTMVDLIPLALTALIVTRDVALILAGHYVRYISLAPPITFLRFYDVTNATAKLQPTTISKVNTVVQLSLVTVSLAAPVFDFVGHPCLQALWFVTAGSTILSAFSYVIQKNTFKLNAKKKKTKS